MIGLFGLFAKHGMGSPTVAKFAWFYSGKSNKNDEGFYYFVKKANEEAAGHREDQGQPEALERVVLLYFGGPGQRHLQ